MKCVFTWGECCRARCNSHWKCPRMLSAWSRWIPRQIWCPCWLRELTRTGTEDQVSSVCPVCALLLVSSLRGGGECWVLVVLHHHVKSPPPTPEHLLMDWTESSELMAVVSVQSWYLEMFLVSRTTTRKINWIQTFNSYLKVTWDQNFNKVFAFQWIKMYRIGRCLNISRCKSINCCKL